MPKYPNKKDIPNKIKIVENEFTIKYVIILLKELLFLDEDEIRIIVIKVIHSKFVKKIKKLYEFIIKFKKKNKIYSKK